jgi:hypothetical protein
MNGQLRVMSCHPKLTIQLVANQAVHIKEVNTTQTDRI